jgi:hypothetical protein
MRIKHYFATIILIFSLSILAFLYINSATRKLPFKSNPNYELTAYFISHDQNYDSLFHVNCRLYATFNKNGLCKLVQKYKDKMIFNELTLNETNIKLLTKYFDNAPDRQDLIHNQSPRIYDGPSIRLNYSMRSTTKALYFITVDDSIYNRVFEEIYSYTLNTKHNNCKDTLALKEMRHKMSTSIRDDIESEFKRNSNYNWDILE